MRKWNDDEVWLWKETRKLENELPEERRKLFRKVAETLIRLVGFEWPMDVRDTIEENLLPLFKNDNLFKLASRTSPN